MAGLSSFASPGTLIEASTLEHSTSMSAPASSPNAPRDDSLLQQRLALYGVAVAQDAASSNDANSASSTSSPPAISSSSALHRRLIATRDFPAGSIILQNTPYAFVLTPLPGAADGEDGGSARQKCEYCGLSVGDSARGSSPSSSKPIEKLLRCSSCRLCSYCSPACQKLAWKSHHSFECKQLWTIPSKLAVLERLAGEAKMDLILLGRCVRRRHKEAAARSDTSSSAAQLASESSGAPLASALEDLAAMESHYNFVTQAIDEHGKSSKTTKAGEKAVSASRSSPSALTDTSILSMAQRMTDNTQLLSIGFKLGIFGPGTTPDDVSTLLLPLLTAFQSNNFALTNGLLITQGAGIFPLGALLNHSCEPSCVIVYEQRAKGEKRDRRAVMDGGGAVCPEAFHHIQTIRTVRDVKAGEELTHSYIDTAAITSKRRAHLAERYYFHCRCTRCLRDESGEDPASFEMCLERDIDGNQLPEDILNPELQAESGKKPAASASNKGDAGALPPKRRADLLRANALWIQATQIHMKENPATTAEAYTAEESRRNREEQTLINSALQIRLQHLHPYSLPLLSSYSKLLHISLLNSDYSSGAHACEMLCRKYRVIYGSREVRERERKRWTDGEEEEVDYVAEYTDLPLHPLLGLQLYTLASVYAELQQFSLALQTFRASLAILQVTHGEQHDMVRRLHADVEAVEHTAATAAARTLD
jgi:hypothetical protein